MIINVKHTFVLGTLFFLAACSTRLPPESVQAFNQCNDQEVVRLLTQTEVKEKDLLLYDLGLLSAGVHGDIPNVAKYYGGKALSNMWSGGNQARGKASNVTSEATRDYKGEPYEKAMAGIYVGAVFFNAGEFDNARAAFQKAVFGNDTKSDLTAEDFPLAYFLLARTYAQLGQQDNARIALDKAKAYSGVLTSIQAQDLTSIHTIVLPEMGQVPKKVRVGPGASLVDYERSKYPERYAYLWVNQQQNGPSVEVEDLYAQAKTIDRKGKTAIQATKGVTREVSAVVALEAATRAGKDKNAGTVAIVAGLFALANQSQADIRQWKLLPDRVHLLYLNDPLLAGSYNYALRFFDQGGKPLIAYDQMWQDHRVDQQPKIYIKKARNCATSQSAPKKGE